MIRALKKLGLDVNERASRHAKAECFRNKEKTTIPDIQAKKSTKKQ